MKRIKSFVGHVFIKMFEWYYLIKYSLLGYTELQVVKDDKRFEYDVCVIIGYGWNFLDANLPILLYLKEHGARICTIIPFCNAYEIAMSEKERYTHLKNVSDYILMNMSAKNLSSSIGRLSYYSKIPLEKNCIKEVVLTIKDFQIGSFFATNDGEVTQLIKGIKGIGVDTFCVCGHCLDYFAEWEDDEKRNDEYYGNCPFDAFLVPSSNGCSEVVQYRNKICLVGAPRLDMWWKNYLINEDSYRALKQYLYKKNKKIIVHIFPVVVDYTKRLTQHEREMYCEAMRELKGYMHVFKFHPRDSRKDRMEFINKFVPNEVEWIETTCDFAQLFDLADLFLTVGISTGVIGLLASGKPQIEFYDDSVKRTPLFKLGEDRYVMYNEYYGLAIHVNDNIELVNMVNKIFTTNIWEEKYKDKALKLFNLDNCASERAADVLFSRIPKYTLDRLDG